jgi:hypothetical protein
MQKLGHNSSMLLRLKPSALFYCLLLRDEICGLRGADGFVNPVLEVPDLIWKIWILNQQEKLTGGICLFQPAGARLVI